MGTVMGRPLPHREETPLRAQRPTQRRPRLCMRDAGACAHGIDRRWPSSMEALIRRIRCARYDCALKGERYGHDWCNGEEAGQPLKGSLHGTTGMLRHCVKLHNSRAGLVPARATSAPGPGPPLPHRHRD
jgi:hypothetical protein